MSRSGKLTRWNDDDWFIVVRFLYQTNRITLDPDQNLKHLREKDIREAAKQIPDAARRREDVFLNMPQIRAIVDRTVRKFKTQLEGSSLRHVPEEKPPITVVAEQTNELMSLFAAKIVEGLEPQLVDRVCERMKLFLAETLINFGALKPGATVEEVVYGKPKQEVRKPKVGLVGLLPIQAESIRNQFPEVEIIDIDGKSGSTKQAIDIMKNKDAVFTWTDKINHSYDEGILNEFRKQGRKEDYKRIHGGPTEIARSLRIWLAARDAA